MSTAEQRYAILLAEEAERARARTTFAFGMVGGLGLTLAGNLALPLVSASVMLSIITFALPPLLAGWGAHLALTVHRAAPRTNVGKRSAQGAVALAALLFGIALVASYNHLRAVFILGGYAPWLASIFAFAIDLALLTVTVAWFAMRPASDAELRAARAEMEAEEAAEQRAREDAERARDAARRAEELAIRNAETDAREAERARLDASIGADMRAVPAPSEPAPGARFMNLARDAHRAGIAKRVVLEKVAHALELLDAGDANGAVERVACVHRDTVQKLREWSESLERAA
ncbi:hypothetical protein [Mycobacteroides franklinii]|uniref:hypothetical protein n=1 Tax=Mycobacteroides franklinii TaxID=948102 RepID=UPI0009929971|nr:hypothetical protein [Mycobacteroides franklinii]